MDVKLLDLGYTNVSVYKDGLEGWKTAGNEVVSPQPVPARNGGFAPTVRVQANRLGHIVATNRRECPHLVTERPGRTRWSIGPF